MYNLSSLSYSCLFLSKQWTRHSLAWGWYHPLMTTLRNNKPPFSSPGISIKQVLRKSFSSKALNTVVFGRPGLILWFPTFSSIKTTFSVSENFMTLFCTLLLPGHNSCDFFFFPENWQCLVNRWGSLTSRSNLKAHRALRPSGWKPWV